jgi:hypothetical protein
MLPKHHKTSHFLKSGLFDNLSSFAELEDRISKLPTTTDMGDAFEVFAEAYFFTQKIEQAEKRYGRSNRLAPINLSIAYINADTYKDKLKCNPFQHSSYNLHSGYY